MRRVVLDWAMPFPFHVSRDRSASRSDEVGESCSECSGTGHRIELIYAVSDLVWGGRMPCMACKGTGRRAHENGRGIYEIGH